MIVSPAWTTWTMGVGEATGDEVAVALGAGVTVGSRVGVAVAVGLAVGMAATGGGCSRQRFQPRATSAATSATTPTQNNDTPLSPPRVGIRSRGAPHIRQVLANCAAGVPQLRQRRCRRPPVTEAPHVGQRLSPGDNLAPQLTHSDGPRPGLPTASPSYEQCPHPALSQGARGKLPPPLEGAE